MSGHSKWATIHRQKEVKDAARGNLFTKLARAITIAAKTGGGPIPESNFKLRITIEKAKAANMPKDNIERALRQAQGGESIEEVTYEGFGPGGIGIIIETATDNRNRTGQEIKNIFERVGGRLAGPGAVSFNFEPKGFLIISKEGVSQGKLLELIDAGVDDFEEGVDEIEAYTKYEKLSDVKKILEEKGFIVESAELIQKPKSWVSVAGENGAEKALAFLDSLAGLDDVQKVYSNLDIPDSLIA
ncbi:MAG: YebC/PmpR family DNA-binding transcriptional regulator [Patescibacteria group bacterium]